MAETISGLIAEAKRNKYSLIPSLTENDVVSVWDAVSAVIVKQMVQQKGVSIAGLGTFTFSQKKIDVGSNKFIVIQRPVFVLSEKFAQTHSLQYTKQHTSGQIPILPLNFTMLSNETAFDRDSVEMCVKEVLQALARSLAARKIIHFDFSNVGRLIVRESRVKMRFFREFIATLDSSGELECAFRPDTSHTSCSDLSIMSAPGTPRPGTSGTLTPRPGTSGTLTPRPGTSGTLTLPHIVQPEGLSLGSTSPRPVTVAISQTTPTRMPSIIEREEPEGVDMTPSPPQSSDSRQLVPKPAGLLVGSPTKEAPATASTCCSSRVSMSTAKGEKHRSASSNSTVKPSFAIRPSTCSHTSAAGQELCYLCHQRAQYNVPVDVSAEREAAEREEERLLQEYQHQHDLLALAREQAKHMQCRNYNQEIASFNVQTTEKKRKMKNEKSSEFHPSYVFQQRALTPAKHLKQQDYCCKLDRQVAGKQARQQAHQEHQESLEWEEQQQLSKELAAHQEAFQKKKAAEMADYQKALAEQVAIKHDLGSSSKRTPSSSRASPTHPSSACGSRLSSRLRPLSLPKPTIILPFSHTKTMTILRDGKMKMIRLKPAPLSVSEPDAQHPVFGVHDVSSEKLRERRDRAKQLFLEQLTMAVDRQRGIKESALRAQEEEAEILDRTRHGLLEDLRAERKKKVATRQALEGAWRTRIAEKQQRLLEEGRRAHEPSMLLHQQCEPYLRCKQCQRQRGNMGQSNLLCESRYISGARLMV